MGAPEAVGVTNEWCDRLAVRNLQGVGGEIGSEAQCRVRLRVVDQESI